jgi:transposase
MNKKYIVSLTPSEREMLKETISRRIAKSSIALNAQILLAADTEESNLADAVISERYHVSEATVQRIREKFVLHGIERALKGLPRGPRSRSIKIDGEVEAHLAQLACSAVPDGYNKWTLRLLADKAVELKYVQSISHEGVRQVLKKTKLNLGNMKCG